MALEKSAGAVVFRKQNSKIYYLVIKYEAGHWEYPKGNLEKGEGWQQAALREIKEETGLSDITFKPEFKETTKYFYKKEGETVYKIVTFFLGETKENKVRLSFEHKNYKWLEYKEALELVTYDEAKEVLKKAHNFLAPLRR